MSQKRHPDDGKAQSEENSPEDKRRRLPNFRNVVLEAMRMQSVQQVLEPMIRKVVREEFDMALTKHLSSMKQSYGTDVREMQPTESRSLQLKFKNSLSLPVFTGARIEGVDGSLNVTLVDAVAGEIVDSGPESSAKLEIVVLEGDFDSDECENWTVEEFKGNILREREGKKPLLMGDPFLNLRDGVGFVGEISFTDNSSWTRSRRFRLGARVVDNFNGIRIREAQTESFIVRDHRGELYKKHHPPALSDEVWRLEKIGKDGAFHRRLHRENIKTVKDFLIFLFLDPPRLRNILGTGMSAKMWDVAVEHARTCVLDKKTYLYYPQGSELKTGVVFNVIGQVMGLLSDGHYVPINKLSETEKADAHNCVISAFQHWGQVVAVDDETSPMGVSTHTTGTFYSSDSPKTEGSFQRKFLTSQKPDGFDYPQSSAFSPDIISSIYSIGSASSLDDYTLQTIDNIDLRYDHTLSFPNQSSNSLICNTESLDQAFYDEDHLQFFDSDLPCQNINYESQASLQNPVKGHQWRRAQRRWRKLINVFKWVSVWTHVTKRTHFQGIRKCRTGL